jgi:hypothetical protein
MKQPQVQLQRNLCWLNRQQRHLQLVVGHGVQEKQGWLQRQLCQQRVLQGLAVSRNLQWRLLTAQALQVQTLRLRRLLMLQLLLMRQQPLRQ